MNVDPLYFAAVGAIGWGLSLVAYRAAAERLGWPMGAAQSGTPIVPVAVGAAGVLTGLLLAPLNGPGPGVGTLLLSGIMFAVFWTGFMRVAAQSALILTPLAIAVLVLGALVRLIG